MDDGNLSHIIDINKGFFFDSYCVLTRGHFLTGSEVMVLHDLQRHELLECIRNGLTPHNGELVPFLIRGCASILFNDGVYTRDTEREYLDNLHDIGEVEGYLFLKGEVSKITKLL